MRKKIITLFLIACLVGAVWVWQNHSRHVSNIVQQYVENGEIIAVKPRYTPDEIMELHKKELIADEQHKFLKPEVKYHPYLLLEIKYLNDKKPREGYSLWSMIDGELVSNTDSWDKSHGFEDALNAGATRYDFLLMQALKQKTASLDQLQQNLHVEKETLSQWINSALSKQLIVQKGNEIQLHFQDPKIPSSPETKVSNLLVKKPFDKTDRLSPKYSANQIIKNAKAAFGEEFTVRNSSDVYLPVYSITVINPDHSTFTTYWNAVNGQQVHPRYSYKGMY